MHNWYNNFQFGGTTFKDGDRCGHPVTVATEHDVAKVKSLIKGDPRITETEIKRQFESFIGGLESDPPGGILAFRDKKLSRRLWQKPRVAQPN